MKRVVRSTLAAESLTAYKDCESAIYISKFLEELLKTEQILILAITDNKSLYKFSNSLKDTLDYLLRVEIASMKIQNTQIPIKTRLTQTSKQKYLNNIPDY